MRFLAALLIAALPLTAYACTCGGTPDCAGIWDPKATVFVGTAVKKAVGDHRLPDGNLISAVPATVTFLMSEVLRGSVGDSVEIHTTDGCCTCGYDFQVGRDYVVFANPRADGSLGTGICNPTQPLAGADALLIQLRAVRDGKSPAVLFGTVSRSKADGTRAEGKRMAGIVVRLSADTADYKAVTDSRGAYAFEVLPAGKYKVVPELPDGFSSRELASNELITILPSTHCERRIEVKIDGLISGMIVDSEGKRITRGFFTLVPADVNDERAAVQDARTMLWSYGDREKTDGTFRLQLIPAGRYYLLLNPPLGESLDFRTRFYYPGTLNRQNAEVIELGEAEHREGLVFRIPAKYNQLGIVAPPKP